MVVYVDGCRVATAVAREFSLATVYFCRLVGLLEYDPTAPYILNAACEAQRWATTNKVG